MYSITILPSVIHNRVYKHLTS